MAQVVAEMRELSRKLDSLQEQVSELKSTIDDKLFVLKPDSKAATDVLTVEAQVACSKLYVDQTDIRATVSKCSQIHVDVVPGSELKIPRFMQVLPVPVEEAIVHACPSGKTRMNLATVFGRFVSQPGAEMHQWTPLRSLVSWSGLEGRFEYVLEHFVRHLPCGADKTISQLLTALFERGRRATELRGREDIGRRQAATLWGKEEYLVGVLRHEGHTPLVPLSLWSHAAIFGFTHFIEDNVSRWLQKLLHDKSVRMRNGVFSLGPDGAARGFTEPTPDLRGFSGPDIDIAISAGGGSDCVTCAAWLAHIAAPSGSIVFHPGRGSPQTLECEENQLLIRVADFPEPLSKGSQFYSGTDLVGRTQHLAKALGLGYEFFFMLQDKSLLGTGSVAAVLEHMNALADNIAEAVRARGRCRQLHVVDTGGDVLMTVIDDHEGDPRKERDVWNLLLSLALQERLNCQVRLIVVAPGIDGQSVWLGPQPEMSNFRYPSARSI